MSVFKILRFIKNFVQPENIKLHKINEIIQLFQVAGR